MWRFVLAWLALLCMPAAADPPPAAAVLAATSLPAREEGATLLNVRAPGRFALVAHSAAGAALQLVDMLTGPGELAGEAGAQDGRIDALLDSGTYKLRVFAAPHATGAVALSALPFHDAAPPAPMPPPGQLLSATLGDLQQRRFWLTIPATGTLRIAATGRALADLVLFRNGRDLVSLPPTSRMAEPEHGHPMTELVAEARLEPGSYLVIAYGGIPAVWPDGATAMPFHIRAGAATTLEAGWAEGTIATSGTEVFALPSWSGALRLELPGAAYAELNGAGIAARIDNKSRTPAATVRFDPKNTPYVELRGNAGQPYRLRVIPAQKSLPREPGTYWVSATTLNFGGDEVTPTLLLARREPAAPSRILASNVPHVGPGLAWHARFNLRGTTDLLVQPDAGGELALRTQGVTLKNSVERDSYIDVPADLLRLHLVPANGAFGLLDLTFGPPGLQAPLADTLPPDPVIPLGVQSLAPGESFFLAHPFVTDADTWLSARPVPVQLGEGPVIVTQTKGQSLTIPLTWRTGQTLAVTSMGGAGPIGFTLAHRGDGGTDVTLGAPTSARTVFLRAPPVAPPAEIAATPEPTEPLAVLQAGQLNFLDLAENETRSFALNVPQGGLFQIETLGRLQTSGEIGTHFIATIATAQANGAGRNMRLTPWLRAGTYSVRVTAQASAGHLGLQAAPAPLLPTPTLTQGGSVRDTLAAGTGRIIPIDVAQDGSYEIAVIGQGEGFSGRIEDDEGWPLAPPGALDSRTMKLRAGHYRLIVTSGTTEQRMVAALRPIVAETSIPGHGPHSLLLGKQVAAVWREPKPGDPNRTPDSFTFNLAGEAHAHVSLSDGMEGLLTGSGKSIRVLQSYNGVLPAGQWRLDARAEGRNDRLDYTVQIRTAEVQPGIPREVTLNSITPFTLAASGIVTLGTTGRVATKAVLRAADGQVVVRAGARANDWNTAISQRLPAGAYTIEILPGTPPGLQPVPQEDSAQPNTDTGSDGDTGPTSIAQEVPAESGESDIGVRLHMDLPQELPAAAAPSSLTPLAGAGLHVLSLPTPPAGALIVATAHGAGTTLVSLERQDAKGSWQTVAQGSGARTFAAALADGQGRPWRAAIWSLDDAATPVTAAVRAITQAPADRLEVPAGLDVAVSRIDLIKPEVLEVSAPPGTMQAAFLGHAAMDLTAGHALPQGKTLWLVGPTAGEIALHPTNASALTLDIPDGAKAILPVEAAAPGMLRFWRADSGGGQPGFSAGAVAPFSAAMGPDSAAILQNAGSDKMLRVHIERRDLTALPERSIETGISVTVPSGQAVLLNNANNQGDLQISLGAGLAAFTDGGFGHGDIWAQAAPVTRTIAAPAHLLLANLGDTRAVAAVSPVPHIGASALRDGSLEKRFFGAAGSFALPAEVPDGGQISVAGNATLFVHDATGKVLTGKHLVPAKGPAEVVVNHGRGLVVLWIDVPGHPVWPDPMPANITLPGKITLSGPAMSLRIAAAGPMLLHATTTAPVLLGLTGAPDALFEAGAAYDRVIDGPSILHAISPQDGPLSGTLALSTEPLRPLGEGLGAMVLVSPGSTAAFVFSLQKTTTIGIGVRAEPDSAHVRVCDEKGRLVGEGVAQLLPNLPAGRYVLEARVLPDAPPTTLRPALLGTVPRASGPPPDIIRSYLEEAGFKPAGNP